LSKNLKQIPSDYGKIENWLRSLKGGNVDGIMIDVWWGIVQRNGPTSYDWSGYRRIFDLCKNIGLKVSAVMSFHQWFAFSFFLFCFSTFTYSILF